MSSIQDLEPTIYIAFERRKPPTASQISAVEGSETKELIRSFNGMPWWEVSDKVIDENYDKLPFFTDLAFHYYFPAYLTRSIRDFSPDNLVVEFVIYSLEPKHYIDSHHFQNRFALFSQQQKLVIGAFLKVVLTDRSMAWHHPDAEVALKSLGWKHQMTD